jgi:GMP synthase-like glutamine amidotransferase
MRALVLEHDRSCPLGRLEPVMARRGVEPELVTPEEIGSLEDPRSYDLAVVLGSDESAYDDSVPWVAEELTYVRRAIAAQVPVLGICFGAQMLARALDAEVRRAERPEVAWKSMARSTEAAWLPAGPWLTWHQDTFDWPEGSTPLAWSDAAPQAFAHGPHVALQFHPEVSAELVEQWLAVDRRKLALQGVDHEELMAETRRRDARAERTATRLFENYFDRLHRS